jgi:hypothetical protein
MDSLPQVLESITEAQVEAMQRALRRVWQRFMWSSLPMFRDFVREAHARSLAADTAAALLEACCEDPSRDDAFATVMHWLAHTLAAAARQPKHPRSGP